MYLNQIDLMLMKNDGKFDTSFKSETLGITEMYWHNLHKLKLKTLKIKKLIISIDSKKEPFYATGIQEIQTTLDLTIYNSLSLYDKKLLILDTVHNALLSIADEQEIDKAKLQQAYDYCIENNLENKWFLGGKLQRSPSKNYYGTVECLWELEFFQATAIIYNSKKEEIKREILFQESSDAGLYDWYIYNSKPIWVEKDNKEYLTLNLKDIFFEDGNTDYWEVSIL